MQSEGYSSLLAPFLWVCLSLSYDADHLLIHLQLQITVLTASEQCSPYFKPMDLELIPSTSQGYKVADKQGTKCSLQYKWL